MKAYLYFQLEGVAPVSYTSKLLEANGTTTGRGDEEKNIKGKAAGLNLTFLCELRIVEATATALYGGKHVISQV